MAVVYYKVGRALIKQNKHMKSEFPNSVGWNTLGSSFNILKYTRNLRTFLICLTTVLCYGRGNISFSVFFILIIANEHNLLMKNVWLIYLAMVPRVAGSYSVNPLIYGMLDKRLLTFLKLCRKKNPRPRGNWLDSSCSKLDKRDIFTDSQSHRHADGCSSRMRLISPSLCTTVKNRKQWICRMTCEGTYLDLALNKHDSKNAWILLLTRT
jgi:hypothetical protein